MQIPQYRKISTGNIHLHQREEKDGDELDITGDLTLNGVTKPVTLEAKLIGQATTHGVVNVQASRPKAKLSSRTSISRQI
ncbi:YceI family protein [Escherichia coli]